MGAAVAGGIGVGIWRDFSQVDRMVGIAQESRPDDERRRRYDDLYDVFNESYAALEAGSIFHRLASLDVD
jgi:xylulokinase